MDTSSVNAILNIDKPYGITTMDVVRRIKRASRLKRVGHGGTLDPVATGVVPICLGHATRVMQYVVEGTKDYRATIELGATTDTYDALGEITGKSDPSFVTLSDINEAIPAFKGVVDQVPPMFSALKRQGKRLYDLARAGVEIEREPRRVEVFRVEILDWSPPMISLDLGCGRGFYMRSFAHDLGQVLGCGGHLKSLVRLRTGPFDISDSLSLEVAEQRIEDGSWWKDLYAPDVVVRELPAIVVGRRAEDMIKNGRALPAGLRIASSRPGERCRVYSVEGRFLAIAAFDAPSRQWRPEKVFAPARSPSTDRRRRGGGLLPRANLGSREDAPLPVDMREGPARLDGAPDNFLQ